jgi:tripartite-type tricarboxylate transporter receptor subunit TctC
MNTRELRLETDKILAFVKEGVGWLTINNPEKLTHVPYKGGGQSALSTASGETDIHFAGLAVLPLVKSGKLNLLAVTGPERQGEFPDTPTVGESLPGYQFLGWNGLFAPAGTPPDIVRLVNKAVSDGMRQPDSIESLRKLDSRPALGSPDELGALVRSELVKWTKVIRDLNLTAE